LNLRERLDQKAIGCKQNKILVKYEQRFVRLPEKVKK
jgi:hypothetical protein